MTKKRKFKTIPKRSGGRTTGLGSGNTITAEQIKNQFFAHASSQRAGKESDCQALADFANSTASIENDAQELTLAVNEQEFNNRKQQLVNKLQDCINNFLKPFLNGLQQKMQSQLNQLQSVTPKHQREILQLEAEIKEADTKYQENIAKANKETDPNKKAKLMALAQEAETELKRAKQKLARNPLSKLVQYSYLYDMGRLVSGNINPDPVNLPGNEPNSDPNDSGSGSGGGVTNPDNKKNP
ncbi:6410_t:CDS:2 [Ambispora gerdemannii]|uniref:6410_t:CDS:1 n=1 Tax=Ambispora gerdemannii TaxID=144530 RepID=A0A9N9CXV4_9GLOM|nr:6410_t:CDS:2 [Ambispora gerdemannii]